MTTICCLHASPRFASSVKRTACAALLLAVAACSPQAPSPVVKTGPVLPSPREMLAQVRAAGAADPDSLEVQPLRDPQVADLRARAITLETHSDYAGAAQAVTLALTITPNDPELLQQSAEFALYQQDWTHAEGFAQQSYDRGPKIGSLCRRNWTTLRFVRLAHNDVAGVQLATTQLAACTLAPPVRM